MNIEYMTKRVEKKWIMPFITQDYGANNETIRNCKHCKGEFKQEELKELSLGSQAGSGSNQHYSDGFFVCRECWDKEGYSDLSNWKA